MIRSFRVKGWARRIPGLEAILQPPSRLIPSCPMLRRLFRRERGATGPQSGPLGNQRQRSALSRRQDPFLPSSCMSSRGLFCGPVAPRSRRKSRNRIAHAGIGSMPTAGSLPPGRSNSPSLHSKAANHRSSPKACGYHWAARISYSGKKIREDGETQNPVLPIARTAPLREPVPREIPARRCRCRDTAPAARCCRHCHRGCPSSCHRARSRI